MCLVTLIITRIEVEMALVVPIDLLYEGGCTQHTFFSLMFVQNFYPLQTMLLPSIQFCLLSMSQKRLRFRGEKRTKHFCYIADKTGCLDNIVYCKTPYKYPKDKISVQSYIREKRTKGVLCISTLNDLTISKFA